MNLKNKQVWLLATLAILILLGLLSIQSIWLKGMLETQEQRRFSVLYEILRDIDDEYEQDLMDEYDLAAITANPNQDSTLLFLAELEEIVVSEMRLHDWWIRTYEYALTSIEKSPFQYFSDEAQKEIILERGVSKKMGSGQHYHLLYLYVPNGSDMLYQGRNGIIALSILFVLALLGVFAYTLFNLAKQKRLSAMKNDFINNLTHEFKTPIATIDLATKTLQNLESVQNDQRATNYVSLIKEEGTRLENHVDKVLQMSLVDSGNFTLEMRTVDVHQKIGAVLQSLQLIMQENKCEFHLDFEAKNAEIQGDKILLFNLFYNLVDNAIKYSEDAPIITITTKYTAEGLLVSIQDNGIGMSESEQLLIFERFYRTNKNKVFRSSGFGLGLSYVKQVADAHGASVRLESELGKGTCIELVFAR